MHKFLFLCFLTTAQLKVIEKKCPDICKCDILNKLKRATCSHQNLVMLESEVPEEAEILDLSYNNIREIHDNNFLTANLLSLKHLNISHNKIGQIHMNAFNGLQLLNTLDLSYNIIQYVIPNWFWSMPNLKELYLRGNNFRTQLTNQPLLESTSLEILDLSNCNIFYLHKNALVNVPNLKELKLSDNYLKQIDINVILQLKYLKSFRINNTLKCDTTTQLAEYCSKHNIIYEDGCMKSLPIKNEEKFQRMVVKSETTTESNSWIYEEDPKINSTACANNSTPRGLLIAMFELSPTISLLTPFILGIILGLVIGCSINILAPPRSYKRRRKNVELQLQIRKTSTEDNKSQIDRTPLICDFNNIGQSTPVVNRRI